MATPAPDCLLALVALTKAGSACFPLPPDAPVGATDTAVGLCLDQAPGLTLKAAQGAPVATDLYAQLAKAREQAALEIRAALEAGRAKSFGPPLFAQRGTLGGAGNGQLAPVGTRALLTLQTNYRPAGALRITRLQLFTDQAVTDAPLLVDGVAVGTITASLTTSLATLSHPDALLVPLDGNRHTVEVLLPGGVRVRANNFFSDCFSCQAGSPWSQAIKNNLRDVAATTPGNGFALTVNEECTVDTDFLCYATGSEGARLRYPDLARYVGLAVFYKAAELFTIGLLAGQDSNRYTLLTPKALNELGAHYASKTAELMAWLNSPEGLGQVQHPCFLGPPVAAPHKVWTL